MAFCARKLSWASFSLGLVLALMSQRDHLGLSAIEFQATPHLHGAAVFDPGFRTVGSLFGTLDGKPDTRIGEISEADLVAARMQDEQVLRIANLPFSDPLPGALTPQFMASMHRFDPNLGNPFVTDQWANWGKLTPLSMNTYSNAVYKSLDPYRLETQRYDSSIYQAQPLVISGAITY